jgi:hypothetical protein
VIAVAVACVPIMLGLLRRLLERRPPSRRIVLGAVVVTTNHPGSGPAGRMRKASLRRRLHRDRS